MMSDVVAVILCRTKHRSLISLILTLDEMKIPTNFARKVAIIFPQNKAT